MKPYDTTAEAEKLLAGHKAQKEDALRWREYCRMMSEHDNDAIESFGAMIPPGEMTKEKLDLAMDMWLERRQGN